MQNFLARARTCATAVTSATAMTTLDPFEEKETFEPTGKSFWRLFAYLGFSWFLLQLWRMIFLGRECLVVDFFSFQHFLTCEISAEKSSDSFTKFPLSISGSFSLDTFRILPVFSFYHDNCIMSWWGPLWGHCIWDSASYTWLSAYFLRLDNFSDPFSQSSPFGTSVMHILFCLIFSQRPLQYLHLFFFSFCYPLWVGSIVLTSSLWFILLPHPVNCWTSLVYFSVLVKLPFATFLLFLCLCWCSHHVHPVFSQV